MWVARRTFIPSKTCSGSGSTLMRLARTWVPPQSTTAATKGVGIPGAANATMVNARTVPSVVIGTVANSVAKHLAHAFRSVEVPGTAIDAFLRDKCGWSPFSNQIVDQRDLPGHAHLHRWCLRRYRLERVGRGAGSPFRCCVPNHRTSSKNETPPAVNRRCSV